LDFRQPPPDWPQLLPGEIDTLLGGTLAATSSTPGADQLTGGFGADIKSG
jgi:hypothetical protein